MSRIAARFEALRGAGRQALIPYIAAGDPHPDVTLDMMHALVEGGADLVELGVPFSDPMADGPVIQRAAERALAHRVSLHHVLDMVARFRERDQQTPVVLMGYLNPVETMGYGSFARAAALAGVDGVLTVDLPPEEAGDLTAALKGTGLDPIFLVAPTSDESRIRRICEAASGFVYYVSVKGVTGAGHFQLAPVARKIEAIRQVTTLPVGVGFGIKDPETAKAVARVADAVIVGSAIVSRVETLAERPEAVAPALKAFVASLRAAMDGE
jgi:tryptophan synthase alpha chain